VSCGGQRRRPAALLVGAVLGGLLLGGLLLSGCALSPADGSVAASPSAGALGSTVGVTMYPAGQRPTIPDLTGSTLDGRTVTLSGLRGHVVVLNTWASWCDPCRAESPALARVARQTSALGVRFVGIDEQDGADAARAFAASAGTTYPQLVDRDGALLASLRVVPTSGVPSTLVLDPTGRVAARVIGPIDEARFATLVRSLASAPAAGVSP